MGTFKVNGHLDTSGPITIKSLVSGNYNEGLRITKAANNWAGITFGSTGQSGAPTGGWFAALNPSGQFIINPDDSGNTAGLCLNKGGNILWRNNVLWHAGNDGSGSGLDADLLDGLHAGSFVQYSKTTLANANNTNLDPMMLNVEGETAISGYGSYWHILNFGKYSGGNFRSQIAMPYQDYITDTDMFIRTANGSTWRAWRKVWHSGNLTKLSQLTDDIVSGHYLPLSGGTINANNAKAPLILKGGLSSYREGLRIIPYSGWADILLAGSDASEASGTSANSWFIGNYNGNFYITRNGSNSSSSAILSCESNSWAMKNGLSVSGAVSSTGFIKSGSSDSYVLLGGGGHKSINNFIWGDSYGTAEGVISDCNSVDRTAIYSSSGFSNRPSDVSNWGTLLNLRLYNSNNSYHRQLFFDCYDTDKIWTRSDNGGTWTAWKEVITTGNYTSYLGYWANVAVSASPNSSTSPTLGGATITGRLYENEWIQFNGSTGLYFPNSNNASHFFPNTYTSYGNFVILGSRGSYSGLQFGNSTTYMTVMDSGTHKGIYSEGWGEWILYFNQDNKRLGLRTSSLTGYAVTCSGDFYCKSGWLRTEGSTGWYNESYGGGWYMSDTSWVRSYSNKGVVAGGFYHTSYGSSSYVLTSDGGAKAISSLSVDRANYAVQTYPGTDINLLTTHGYYAIMTTQSGITGDWWHILHMDWSTAANWRSELALPTQKRNGVYYRSDGGDWSFGSWIKLMDTSNYSTTSITSIDTSYHVVFATISSNQTLGVNSVPIAGHETHVIIQASGAARTVTIPTTGNYISLTGSSLVIASGSYGEINLLSNGSKIFIRAV